MSIWVSVGEPAEALDGANDNANYRAEGEPAIGVDVAIAEGYHDHIRLAVWRQPGHPGEPIHLDAVLSPRQARQLYENLGRSLP